MRALITGGSGFVGLHLVQFLRKCTSHIAVLASSEPAERRHEVEYFVADIRDEERVCSVVKETKPDQIFHLAAISNINVARKFPRLTFEVNVLGTYNVLRAATEVDYPIALLNVSTSQVYARSLDRLSEASPIAPENPYAASKAMAELLVYQCRERPARIVTARPFNHTGRGQLPEYVLSSMAKQFAEIELGLRAPRLCLGNLAVQRDFLDVRDVVRAYCALVESGRSGEIYNVCSGKAVLLSDVVKMFRSVSGAEVVVEVDAEKVRSNETLIVSGTPEKIRAETGWTCGIPLEETIADMLDYWRSQCHKC